MITTTAVHISFLVMIQCISHGIQVPAHSQKECIAYQRINTFQPVIEQNISSNINASTVYY